MEMNAILHADRNWGIGKGNGLMFSLPADMKFFRETTKGGIVVMGSNTLRSFPNGAPLKNRVNVVFSSSLQREDCLVVRNLEELKGVLTRYADLPVWVIGGGSVYRLLLPYCRKVLVTRVDADGDADTFFPNLDEDENFVCKKGEELLDNGYLIRFDEYENKNVKEL